MQEKEFIKGVLKQDMPDSESVRRNILQKATTPSRRLPAIRLLAPTAVCAAVLLAVVLISNQAPLDPQIPTYQIISGDRYSQMEDQKQTGSSSSQTSPATGEDVDVGSLAAARFGEYVAANGYPDYLGGTYVTESGTMVVLLADDTEANRNAILSIVGQDEDVRFEQATYSYGYLTTLMGRLADGMTDGSLSCVLYASLDDRENRIQVYVSSASDAELLALSALDTAGKGKALDIYLVESPEDTPHTDDYSLSAPLDPDVPVTAALDALTTAAGSQQLVFTLTNGSDSVYMYGKEPLLDVEKNGAWSPVSLRENVGWEQVAIYLNPDGTHEITVPLSVLYGDLPQGHYRYRKVLTDEDTGDAITVQVEFDMK